MAINDIKMSQLPTVVAEDLTVEAIMEVVDNGVNKKLSVQDLRNIILPFYAFSKMADVVIIDDTYQEVSRLEVDSVEIGTYRYQFDVSYTYDSTNTSPAVRFSLDNGSTWTEFTAEFKDKLDTRPFSYGFPLAVTESGGQIILVEARKGANSATMEINYCDISLERKGVA